MEAIIKVQNLCKSFGELKAVDRLSFTVNRGEIYGFLGQNGAGKSTSIRMLLTLIEPDEGSIEIFGYNLATHRKTILGKVGAIIERPDMYKYLSAYENLSLFARMSGVRLPKKELMAQLEMVGLAERAHSKVRSYSQGMKQRLGLAIALAHNPDLIILDEPTNGLDPQGIADVRNLVLRLSRQMGKSVLVSSHLLGEVQMIADRMLIVDKGKKMVEGSVKELLDPSHMIVSLEVTEPAKVWDQLQGSGWRPAIKGIEKGIIILELNRESIPIFCRDLLDLGAGLISLQPRHTLEDYFLSLTTANRHVDTFAN